MKKIILSAVLAACAVSAHAECRITMVRDDQVATNFDKYGGFTLPTEQFNKLCAKLNRARARIQIVADATVLSNQSIGWAALTVVDRDTNVQVSDYASSSTHVNTFASQNKADELMIQAINDAAANWPALDKALAVLDEARKKVRVSS